VNRRQEEACTYARTHVVDDVVVVTVFVAALLLWSVALLTVLRGVGLVRLLRGRILR